MATAAMNPGENPAGEDVRKNLPVACRKCGNNCRNLRFVVWEVCMNGIIYLVGLIVVVLFILSFLGLR
jgi:hypothetical protein